MVDLGISADTFVAAVALYLVSILMAVGRWYIILQGLSPVYSNVRPWDLVKAYFTSYAVFSFTPLGRLGSEAVRGTYIMGRSRVPGVIASIALERILDGLATAGLIGGWLLAVVMGWNPLAVSLFVMALVPIIVASREGLGRASIRIEGWVSRLPRIGRAVSKILGGSPEPSVQNRILSTSVLMASAVLTAVSWTFNLAHISVILEGFGVSNPLNAAPGILLVEMLALGTPLPIPAGLGVMDLLTAFVLSKTGLTAGAIGGYLVVERLVINVIPGTLGLILGLNVVLDTYKMWKARKKEKDKVEHMLNNPSE